MKVFYDPSRDTVRIIFLSAPIFSTAAESSGLIIDYATDGTVVGLEMTQASQRIHDPSRVELCFSPAGKKPEIIDCI